MRWWPPLLHLLAIAAVLPLAWLRLDAAWQAGPVAPVSAATEAEPVALPGAGMAVPAALAPVDLQALADRPLFVPGRQVAQESAAEPAAPSVSNLAAGLRMVGYLDDGTKPRAILALDGTGAEAIVREGDAFEGYEVRQITRDAVVVINRGEEITVKLFDQ